MEPQNETPRPAPANEGLFGFAFCFMQAVQAYATLTEIGASSRNGGNPVLRVGACLQAADRLPLAAIWDEEKKDMVGSPIEKLASFRGGVDSLAYELVQYVYGLREKPEWLKDWV